MDRLPAELTEMVAAPLDQDDFFNLRLVNRRVHKDTFKLFEPFFVSRKHMVSRYSVQAIHGISQHETLRHRVQELIIGPERLNIRLADENAHTRKKDWKPNSGPVFEQLLKEQQDFENSGHAVTLLGEAVANLPNLKSIVLSTYPEDKRFEPGHWMEYDCRRSWGSKTLLQQVERLLYAERLWPGDWVVLTNKWGHRANLHLHYWVMVQALYPIKDSNWTLDIEMNSLRRPLYTELFRLDCDEWELCSKRVRSMLVETWTTKQTPSERHPDYPQAATWTRKLLKSCTNIESLTVRSDRMPGSIFSNSWWRLSVLDLKSCLIENNFFARFLERHSGTLGEIRCWGCGLYMVDRNGGLNVDGGLAFDGGRYFHGGLALGVYNDESEDDHEDEITDKDETSSWFRKIAIMGKMERLKSIDLLIWRHGDLTNNDFNLQPLEDWKAAGGDVRLDIEKESIVVFLTKKKQGLQES
ncbi:hypothetical protein P154DRAFT_198938 [Amniculicola lignicola CBS 123094]|uniref:F-box domain-containing protein n=1 Tax=Amniculicola lignicola CBS 123094 TaxID=1392246 RepID=A0A6A5WNG6_9PLEO|nr:hypothetical protein P154DRAFT_198938 [Amniculicola lignicola CBS 123094]